MNPGAAEEAGKAANTFMAIMKEQPLSLALVFMNVLLLGLFFYVIQVATGNRAREFERILDAQAEVQKLLVSCRN